MLNTNQFQQQANQAVLAYLMQHISVEELNQQIYKLNNETMRDMQKHQGSLLLDHALKYLELLKNHNDLQEISRNKNAKNSEFCLKIFD